MRWQNKMSKSEGVFEKRRQIYAQKFNKPILFKEDIDDAKREFPKLPKNPNVADRVNHSIECLEWALKWFGEQE